MFGRILVSPTTSEPYRNAAATPRARRCRYPTPRNGYPGDGGLCPRAVVGRYKTTVLHVQVQSEAVISIWHPDSVYGAYSTVLFLCRPGSSWWFILGLPASIHGRGLCHTIDEIVEALERRRRMLSAKECIRIRKLQRTLSGKMLLRLVGWARDRSYGDGYAVPSFGASIWHRNLSLRFSEVGISSPKVNASRYKALGLVRVVYYASSMRSKAQALDKCCPGPTHTYKYVFPAPAISMWTWVQTDHGNTFYIRESIGRLLRPPLPTTVYFVPGPAGLAIV